VRKLRTQSKEMPVISVKKEEKLEKEAEEEDRHSGSHQKSPHLDKLGFLSLRADTGTDVMILKIFSPKKIAKKLGKIA
jgi:hypothetical protein